MLQNYKEVVKYNVGSAVTVTGTVVLTPEAKQPLEIHAQQIDLEGASTSDYPLQKKRHSLEFLRSIAHLRPRTNTFSAAFECVLRQLMRFTSFLTKMDSYMRIHRSSLPATAKVREKCFG